MTAILLCVAGVFKSILGRFLLDFLDEVPVPIVWTSLYPECIEKLSDTLSQDKKDIQVNMVEVANAYYFDYAAPIRTPERFEHSADSLHLNTISYTLLSWLYCESASVRSATTLSSESA